MRLGIVRSSRRTGELIAIDGDREGGDNFVTSRDFQVGACLFFGHRGEISQRGLLHRALHEPPGRPGGGADTLSGAGQRPEERNARHSELVVNVMGTMRRMLAGETRSPIEQHPFRGIAFWRRLGNLIDAVRGPDLTKVERRAIA